MVSCAPCHWQWYGCCSVRDGAELWLPAQQQRGRSVAAAASAAARRGARCALRPGHAALSAIARSSHGNCCGAETTCLRAQSDSCAREAGASLVTERPWLFLLHPADVSVLAAPAGKRFALLRSPCCDVLEPDPRYVRKGMANAPMPVACCTLGSTARCARAAAAATAAAPPLCALLLPRCRPLAVLSCVARLSP